MNFLKTYAKALVLLALIILTAIADLLGVDVGLDIQHYIALLLADIAVWATPNKDNELK